LEILARYRRTDIEARDYHLLMVHSDADNLTATDAREQHGLRLVKWAGENACQDVLPIIPIRAIEAALMADDDAVLRLLGTN
jgi:hypothetical protein